MVEHNFQFLQLAVFGSARNKSAFSEEDKKKYLESWSRPGAILAGVNYYRAFPRSYKGSGIIKVPTLVIWGLGDIFLLPKQLDRMPEFVRNLKIIKIEHSSHWIIQDEPDRVTAEIVEFINTI